jgi:hypothetical protein
VYYPKFVDDRKLAFDDVLQLAPSAIGITAGAAKQFTP